MYEQAPFFAAMEAADLLNPIIKPYPNIHTEKWSIFELVLMGKVTHIAQLPYKSAFRIQTAFFIWSFQHSMTLD